MRRVLTLAVLTLMLSPVAASAVPIQYHVGWQFAARGDDPASLDGAFADLYLVLDTAVTPYQRCDTPCGGSGYAPNWMVYGADRAWMTVTGSAGRDGRYRVAGFVDNLILGDRSGSDSVYIHELWTGLGYTSGGFLALLPPDTWSSVPGSPEPFAFSEGDVLEWRVPLTAWTGVTNEGRFGGTYDFVGVHGSAHSVPEPATAMLALLGLGLMRKRIFG